MFDNRMSHAELLEAAEKQNERLVSALIEIERLRAALDKIIGVALGSRMDPDFPAAKVHKIALDALMSR
jgi:hypothetical protein